MIVSSSDIPTSVILSAYSPITLRLLQKYRFHVHMTVDPRLHQQAGLQLPSGQDADDG
jgi:hypothetical protein